jgi:hypothetical protein
MKLHLIDGTCDGCLAGTRHGGYCLTRPIRAWQWRTVSAFVLSVISMPARSCKASSS